MVSGSDVLSPAGVNNLNNIEPKNRKYMREYKRRQYAEKGDLIRAKNKAYYYKTKFGLNTEDMKKYDTLLPLVAKITRHLEELQEQKPELIPDVLQPFLVPRY